MAFDPTALLKKNQEKNNLINSLNIANSNPKMQLGKLKKEEVLAVVKAKGPVTPTEIKRELNAETYLISAILSELVNSKIVNTTTVKKGTSIFYYLPEQKQKLENLTKFLNEKDQRTVILLKENKVLEDKTQELLIRVSFRKIKDYALPLNIRVSENEVKLFWRYFLVNDEEAKSVIRQILRPIVDEEPPKKEEIKQTPKIISVSKPVITIEKQKEKPIQTKIIEKDEKLIDKNIDEKLIGTKFFEDLKDSFAKKGIIIESAIQIRKNKELDLIIVVKTSLGKSRYFAKYKNKKRCNDSDISNAVVIAQSKHLPVAFITTGEIAKKTKEKINTLFHNVMIVEGFE